MKSLLKDCPEGLGLLVGFGDVVFRAIAAVIFAPSEAQRHGWLLLGNVHHHTEIRAFGLSTMEWFGISGVVLAFIYGGVRLSEYGARPGNAGFLLSRGLLGVVAGVLVLNVVESLVSGKVTNYIGWVHGSRFTAINFGDVLIIVCLFLVVPAMVWALTEYVLAKARVQ